MDVTNVGFYRRFCGGRTRTELLANVDSHGHNMKISLTGRRVQPFVRQLFQESAGSFDWMAALNGDLGRYFDEERDIAEWQGATPAERGLWLTGKLWNDTAIMPDNLCERLDLNWGCTYARGARKQRFNHQSQLLPKNQ
jgi:hypothetical protein